MSDYILTYSKIKFYPLEPIKEDINIIDIAHALSLMTRANGHFKHFYSVAQHCVSCCKEAKQRGYSQRVQLGCLLHDASESYISDLTRPVKKNLSAYFDIEAKLQQVIYERFGLGDLTEAEKAQIFEVDDALLYCEFKELMDVDISANVPQMAMKHDFSQRDFISVESEFISCFKKLTGTGERYKCVGIDGCKGKWIAVCITESGFEVEKINTINEICQRYSDADSVIIDIPIGLVQSKDEIRPDALLKKWLGSKGSSVFGVPCRQAIYAENDSIARAQNIKILGKSLSAQTLGITKSIRQVDEFLQCNIEWKNRLVESHPEFCFSKLNNNKPVLENKLTEEGQQKRLDILEKYYPDSRRVVEKYLNDIPFRKKIDDVIDALCLAVTGELILKLGKKTIPETPMMDAKGLLMQIVYSEQ